MPAHGLVKAFTKEKPKSSGAVGFLPVPLHEGCYQLMRRFCAYQLHLEISFRAANGGAPSSIAHFWEP